MAIDDGVYPHRRREQYFAAPNISNETVALKQVVVLIQLSNCSGEAPNNIPVPRFPQLPARPRLG